MTRPLLASITVICMLTVAPYAGEAQKPTATNGALPKFNQVYVKIILPIDPTRRDKDRLVVETWIAEQLKKRGQPKLIAATSWVPLVDKRTRFPFSTEVWDGGLEGKSWGCPVDGVIVERADGRVKVVLRGWSPADHRVTISLADEPGSREIVAGEYMDLDTEQRRLFAYVAVLIGPPSEKTATFTDHKK